MILDADILLGYMEIVTLSPIFHTRVFHSNYYYDYDDKRKSSLLWAYGLDALFEFSDAFNLELGIAGGNIVKDKSLDGNVSSKNSASGFLFKVAPSFNFGINDVSLSYSLGIGRDISKEKSGSDYEKDTECATYGDLWASWHFLLNDYVAFGPVFGWVSDSYKSKYDYKYGGDRDNGTDDYKSGNNIVRFGLEFVASF